MNTEILLDHVQQQTFRYFWDFAHPLSGLTRERDSSGDVVTIGGSGFAVMAILVGIERGFITRQEGLQRLLTIVGFLESAVRFHGAWPHWVNGVTGQGVSFSQKDDGGDLVETALLVQGLLAARQYFHSGHAHEQLLREKITLLWETVEWDWYRRDGEGVLYWHWSPNQGWAMNLPIRGFNEAMIVYLLAIASPTHGVPASLYHSGWAGLDRYRNGRYFYNHLLEVGLDWGGPLFFAHYSFLGFDPRNRRDAYCNYFQRNRNHTLINRAYCIENPKGYTGYSAKCWGLSASDCPLGYAAHEPWEGDYGTLTPTAALSSMPYTPDYCIQALEHFYFNLGDRLWGPMGFYDAFNPHQGWFAKSYLAINQGPIIVMIENYRSAPLWELFMANSEILPMLEAVGFKTDVNRK
jgi:hypothetical protein